MAEGGDFKVGFSSLTLPRLKIDANAIYFLILGCSTDAINKFILVSIAIIFPVPLSLLNRMHEVCETFKRNIYLEK